MMLSELLSNIQKIGVFNAFRRCMYTYKFETNNLYLSPAWKKFFWHLNLKGTLLFLVGILPDRLSWYAARCGVFSSGWTDTTTWTSVGDWPWLSWLWTSLLGTVHTSEETSLTLVESSATCSKNNICCQFLFRFTRIIFYIKNFEVFCDTWLSWIFIFFILNFLI